MSLVAELQRRRVFRALVGYGVASFAVLQIIEPKMHGLHWPDAVLSYTVVEIAVGFPIVVSLAWIFDVNRGPDRADSSSRQRAEGGAPRFPAGGDRRARGNSWRGLVLRGAVASSLHVAGRTSSFAFKGKNEDLRSIGQKLNVATVLEGSVQKAGDRVRITMQLINAADGYHLWSESYDRKLTDVFAVQDEIAQAVVAALKLKLLQQPTTKVRRTATSKPSMSTSSAGSSFIATTWMVFAAPRKLMRGQWRSIRLCRRLGGACDGHLLGRRQRRIRGRDQGGPGSRGRRGGEGDRPGARPARRLPGAGVRARSDPVGLRRLAGRPRAGAGAQARRPGRPQQLREPGRSLAGALS